MLRRASIRLHHWSQIMRKVCGWLKESLVTNSRHLIPIETSRPHQRLANREPAPMQSLAISAETLLLILQGERSGDNGDLLVSSG